MSSGNGWGRSSLQSLGKHRPHKQQRTFVGHAFGHVINVIGRRDEAVPHSLESDRALGVDSREYLKAFRLFFFDASLAEGRGFAGFELGRVAKRCRVGFRLQVLSGFVSGCYVRAAR